MRNISRFRSFRKHILLAAMISALACSAEERNTKYSSGFSPVAFAAINTGDPAEMVEKKLGAPLETRNEQTQVRLVYAQPKNPGKPYTRKEILLREGKVAQKFDESSAEQ